MFFFLLTLIRFLSFLRRNLFQLGRKLPSHALVAAAAVDRLVDVRIRQFLVKNVWPELQRRNTEFTSALVHARVESLSSHWLRMDLDADHFASYSIRQVPVQ